jgi:uncharacterized protein YecE (DUF72 family)
MPVRKSTPTPAPDLSAAHDPGFDVAAQRGAAAAAKLDEDQRGAPLVTPTGTSIRVGTASWTDPTMTKGGVFYPRGISTAEARLRYYASQFSVVEVDSTYYSLPDAGIAQLWVERTPDQFQFHIKAHALMTGQPTEVSRLPQGLVDALPAKLRAQSKLYAKDLSPEISDSVWHHFIAALTPLRDAGKLGSILLQYPRWFLPTPENKDLLAESALRLAGIPATVELRNGVWFKDSNATQRTLDMLHQLGLTHVIVDGPQGLVSSVPFVHEITNDTLAMVRFHGRRSATWEAPGVATVERYRYLYSEEELMPLIQSVRTVTKHVAQTVAFMNNCYGNYGATNAREMLAMLAA